MYSQDVAITGMSAATTNTTFLATTEGTWRWQVSYAGDANNTGFTSACGVEQFTLNNHATG